MNFTERSECATPCNQTISGRPNANFSYACNNQGVSLWRPFKSRELEPPKYSAEDERRWKVYQQDFLQYRAMRSYSASNETFGYQTAWYHPYHPRPMILPGRRGGTRDVPSESQRFPAVATGIHMWGSPKKTDTKPNPAPEPEVITLDDSDDEENTTTQLSIHTSKTQRPLSETTETEELSFVKTTKKAESTTIYAEVSHASIGIPEEKTTPKRLSDQFPRKKLKKNQKRSLGKGHKNSPIPVREKPPVITLIKSPDQGWSVKTPENINPWDPNLIANLLQKIPTPLGSLPNVHIFRDPPAPLVKVGCFLTLGTEQFKVTKLLGEGAFAKAYKVQSGTDGGELVIKVQKPSCPWEVYICDELGRRFSANENSVWALGAVMQVKSAFLYSDGSFLVNEYHSKGTILDLMNKVKQCGRSSVGEYLALYFAIQIFKILEASHSAGIIHADVKPDNFLINRLPSVHDTPDSLLSDDAISGLKLIDWGRSIDTTLFGDGTTFSGSAETSGFRCIEMLKGRPWTFQADFFGMVATCHMLLFGTYMKVFKSKVTGQWGCSGNFKRKWNVQLWKSMFRDFMNVESCDCLPDLRATRREMQEYFRMCLEEEWDKWKEDVIFINKIFE